MPRNSGHSLATAFHPDCCGYGSAGPRAPHNGARLTGRRGGGCGLRLGDAGDHEGAVGALGSLDAEVIGEGGHGEIHNDVDGDAKHAGKCLEEGRVCGLQSLSVARSATFHA